MIERHMQTFSDRADLATSVVAKRLFKLMTEKESNLCLALDVTDPDRFLAIAEAVGPHLAVLKTHVDTLSSFTPKLTIELVAALSTETCIASQPAWFGSAPWASSRRPSENPMKNRSLTR